MRRFAYHILHAALIAAVAVALNAPPALAQQQQQPKVFDPTTGASRTKPDFDPTTGLGRSNKPDFDPTTGVRRHKTPLFDPTTGLSNQTGVVAPPSSFGRSSTRDRSQDPSVKVVNVRVYDYSGEPLDGVVVSVESRGLSTTCTTSLGSCRVQLPCCAGGGELFKYRLSVTHKGQKAEDMILLGCGQDCSLPALVNLRLLGAPAKASTTTRTPSASPKPTTPPATLKRYTTGGSKTSTSKPPKRYSPDWRPWSQRKPR